ncbi:MAG: hypothetical protein KKH77_03535 [Candidatus Omnitrophica bacterium]|nr:hypothetical protein [Candidatus Omnitrophota bacterium]MBU0881215.1 hypothetical protein [Candidatus Omnitrophota bacterium]MBU0895954.1 hypothetical protein [Candidatus Omnitrophota bacterium]MBU1809226.1 hypothetical protein [Candidatus Omnitrophota bacterium]
MNNQKCINCGEHKKCQESRISWIFFIIGLIATIAIRAVTVLVHIDPIYGQIAWYVGISGFFVFFIYKFKVEHARSQLIKNSKLVHKISQGDNIEKGDRELIGSLLCALSSNKDKINYLVIFVSSAIAIAIAVYLDFIR